VLTPQRPLLVRSPLLPTSDCPVPTSDSLLLQDAKKAAKKDVKQALKALHLDREPPAYVDEHDADAFLLACGLPVSKLATLKVTFGERLVSRGDLFSKTKAAHRCVEPRVHI
jgi:hypothetical protein